MAFRVWNTAHKFVLHGQTMCCINTFLWHPCCFVWVGTCLKLRISSTNNKTYKRLFCMQRPIVESIKRSRILSKRQQRYCFFLKYARVAFWKIAFCVVEHVFMGEQTGTPAYTGQRCVFGGAPMVAVECLGVGCYFLRIVFVLFSSCCRLVAVFLP